MQKYRVEMVVEENKTYREVWEVEAESEGEAEELAINNLGSLVCTEDGREEVECSIENTEEI